MYPWFMLARKPRRLRTETFPNQHGPAMLARVPPAFWPHNRAEAKTPFPEPTSKKWIDQFLTWKIAMAEPIPALPPSTVRDKPVPWPQQPAVEVNARLTPLEESTSKLRNLADDFYQQARLRLEEARRWASRVTSRSRRNLRYLAEERPVQVVIGVAAVCFLAGAALRIWRSSHE